MRFVLDLAGFDSNFVPQGSQTSFEAFKSLDLRAFSFYGFLPNFQLVQNQHENDSSTTRSTFGYIEP
jgi:hypothetical protein